jgi:hypothetical protein
LVIPSYGRFRGWLLEGGGRAFDDLMARIEREGIPALGLR